jgi:hypothetical protein
MLKHILIFFSVVILCSCHKHDSPYNAYFYTNPKVDLSIYQLYIDGNYKGDLPCLNVKPVPDNDSLLKLTLFISLEAGKHDLVMKKQDGTEVSINKIKVKPGSLHSNGTMGGCEITSSGQTLVIGLFP